MTTKLLSRDAFREGVFARDRHRCVFCHEPAADAHHIIERRLWPDGGYYLDNGASVCEKHHKMCESTEISVEDARIACGIKTVMLPPHLERDQLYDKWGNPILSDGRRLKGELFHDQSVQAVLDSGSKLALFTNLVKYPRTFHLPWSESLGDDDHMIPSLDAFQGERVIVSEKMDGESTSLYCDYIHARSIDGRSHPSRDWVKQFWSGIAADIPEGWRICGENLYAKHSIRYTRLPSYFMGFSIWNDSNWCLPWDETVEWFRLLGVEPVPVIYDGIFDEKRIRELWTAKDPELCEGYVVRLAGGFPYGQFRRSVGKFVRARHVQTSNHWMRQAIVANALA